jgi:hypothetical protein
MRLKRENQQLLVSLNPLESRLLLRVLRELVSNYRLAPDELDTKTASAWYSTRGCAAATSVEETREWSQHLHAFKSARVQLLEKCVKQLAEPRASPMLRLEVDEAPAFMTAINDHRLMVAARQDIGQTEMDVHSPLQLAGLPPAQQNALIEIHFLAWLIEETIRALQQ